MQKKHLRLLLVSTVFLFVVIFGCAKKQSVDYVFWGNGVDKLNKSMTDKFWQKTRHRSNLTDAYTRLGGFYQKQGKHRKAIAEFIKAIKTKTADAGVYNSLAMSYDALKKYKFAEMAYKDAIALAPEQPYLYNNYGCSSLLRGDIQAAIALFEKAASLDAESRRIKNNLALAIHRGNKNEILNKDNQKTTQLPGLHVTERIPADNAKLTEEIDSADLVGPVSPDEVIEAVKVAAVSRPIMENIDEPAKEVTLIKPARIQPDVEEIPAVKVLGESVTEATVVKNVQDEKERAEIQPVMVENVVIEPAEVVEEVQIESPPPAEFVETSIDETVLAENAPVHVAVDDSEKTTTIAATSSDDEDNWYNDLLVYALTSLGLRSDEETVNVAPSIESDKPAVVATTTKLTDDDTVSVENRVQKQEKVIEKSIVDTPPNTVIHINPLQLADSIKDDIAPKLYMPIAEAIVPTLSKAASVKTKVVAATDTDHKQDVQTRQKVAIEVSNGNGVTGMATRSAAYFKKQGQNVRRITNAKNFGFKDSIVFYREGYLREAYKIALMVPGYQKMKRVESLGRSEITIKLLLGKDMAPLQFPESMAGMSRKKISTYRDTVALLSR